MHAELSHSRFVSHSLPLRWLVGIKMWFVPRVGSDFETFVNLNMRAAEEIEISVEWGFNLCYGIRPLHRGNVAWAGAQEQQTDC